MIRFNTYVILFAAFLLLQPACRQQAAPAHLFVVLSAAQTGIDFSNRVDEDIEFNILTYQYLYNGAGVAVGDVNGDGLCDIFFTGNAVPNRLYLNKGGLKFEDVTTAAGVAGRTRWKTGTSMADVNGDGLLDIYVCYSGPGTDAERSNELYINEGIKNGSVVFAEKAAEYGLDAPGTFTTQVAFFDMDNDDDLDAFMVNHADMFYNAFFNTGKLRNLRHPKFGNRLYRNDNNKFTDISSAAGIHGSGLNFGLSVAVSDLNMDGWPDLYVTNDYNEQDFLYLNNKGNSFTEVLQKSMGHISKFSMGSDVADCNNDLRPDVVTMDMLPEDNARQKALKGPDNYDVYHLLADSGFHYQDMRNMLQVNVATDNGTPVFSEGGQLAGISNTDWSWAPLFCDFNNDGWKDLYFTNGYLRDFTNLDFLKFTFAEAQSKAQAAGGTLNNWELVKRMPSTKISNYCFVNNGPLHFADATKQWGLYQPSISTGAAYADLDNDGDMDLVVNNSNDVASVFENKTAQQGATHYLRLRLKGSGANSFAIGAKVTVQTDSATQMSELYTARGFQSSVAPELHFGLGSAKKIKTLQVTWPGGKQTTLQNINADTLLQLEENTATNVSVAVKQNDTNWFSDVTAASGLLYKHQETGYVDFRQQYLLLNQLSKQGPFLAKADVDKNGLEDVFVGGNSMQQGKLFLQQTAGNFLVADSQPWMYAAGAKDAGVVFFDAEGDGDQDLFIVRGGSEKSVGDAAYQDHLYINDGKGRFSIAQNSLPPLLANGSCLAASDFDKDGDIDLFVGGAEVPGSFPITDYSYLLRNESKNGKLQFVYATDQPEKTLRHPGRVSTAVWADVNNDNWPDLIVAGSFMPVTVFENNSGKLTNATIKYGLNNSNGLWSKLAAADVDGDGDTDLIAGNAGLNSQLRASLQQPLSVCYDDFDKNGSIDPLVCYYVQGKEWPLASLDELAEQLPAVRKKFLRYNQFASATLEQIITPQQAKTANRLFVYNLASCYLQNNGKGNFDITPLPVQAQLSRINSIVVHDFDGDGTKDLLLHGNDYSWRAQLGRMDAGYGLICKGLGNGKFEALPLATTGLLSRGNVQDMLFIKQGTAQLAVLAKNNEALSVSKIEVKK